MIKEFFRKDNLVIMLRPILRTRRFRRRLYYSGDGQKATFPSQQYQLRA